MKVLYIGNYRDGTGWSRMGLETIQALHAVGVDVTTRPIKLNKVRSELPLVIASLERKNEPGYDAVIQNVLPHMADYCGKIPKNIVYYCSETTDFSRSNWPQKINCMDEAWVCNEQSQTASENSGVTAPLKVVPIACDVNKYQRKYKPLPIRERLADSFIFYYIGDFNKRKNIGSLVKAFHLEFDPGEPVDLVIKTDIGQGSRDEYDNMKSREAVMREINGVKEAMKLYDRIEQYKQEIILVGRYTDEEVMRLHASCDCFVCPSYGEAWCIPAFDAMAMGRTPIVTAWSGFPAYLSNDTGWLVDYNLEPVFAMHNTQFSDLFTSREHWASVNIDHLRQCMRTAFEGRMACAGKAKLGRQRAYDFSYEKVGKRIYESLLVV